MKTISVIIPVYNGEKYIKETIQSIQSQSYPIHEVVIINDGSTDGTQKIIHELIKEFSNIIYLNQENAGPAKARNYGIKKSTGEYIAFCDADDIWESNKIEQQVKIFETDLDIALVCTGMSFFGSRSGNFISKEKEISTRKLLWENSIPNSSVVMKKSVVENIGFFNETQNFFSIEDYEYWLRISNQYKIVAIQELLVHYRIHDNQISKRSSHSYKKLQYLYKNCFYDYRYRKYWHICLIRYIENMFKYYYSSLVNIWNPKKQ